MLQVLEAASQNVFVPLTVGGGIREYVDADGKVCMAPNEKFFFFCYNQLLCTYTSNSLYGSVCTNVCI